MIIAVLLLANIGVLAYFMTNKPLSKRSNPAMQRKNAMAVYLKNDVGFDTLQLKLYDSLNSKHRKALEPLFDQLKTEKEKRLHFLAENDYSDSAIIQAVNRSAERQKMLDLEMLQHLKNIRALCTNNQKQKFDTSIYKIMTRRGGDKNKTKKQS
jgi:hypothetical protein